MTPEEYSNALEAVKRVSFRQILDSGEYSDLEIRCRDDSYKVHRAIVLSQSPVLRNACRPEYGFKEASGVIELHDEDPFVVHAIVQHLYGDDYEAPMPEPDEDPTLFHISVYGAAEMYQINGLKDIAMIHIKYWFPEAIASKEIEQAVGAAYSITVEQDRPLRDYISRTVFENMEQLRDSPQLSAALEESSTFGKDLVNFFNARRRDQEKYAENIDVRMLNT
ncbi:hypothetical protein IWZ01DRAFT_88280 [Phyllosticta capitalensis]